MFQNMYRKLFLSIFLVLFSTLGFARNLPDFVELTKEAAPSVVNISTTQTIKGNSGIQGFGFPDGIPDIFRDFFEDFGGTPNFGETPDRKAQSLGSGFIISEDGYILTNNHVVENADEIIVSLADRRTFKAKLIGGDKTTDVALLKIDAKNLPKIKLSADDDLQAGEWVFAMGSPFGFDHSVTAGIVSAVGRALPDSNYVPFIQTDVAINPGNSGGPLFNLDGEVVGINSQIYTRSGGYMGVSFSIPINFALNISEQLKNNGSVSRGYLGIIIQSVDADLAESFGMSRAEGALVAQIDPKGPAAKSSLKVGDVILAVDGKKVKTSSDLPLLIGQIKPGKGAKLQVLRDGKNHNIYVTVGQNNTKEASVAKGGKGGSTKNNVLGAQTSNIGADIKQKLGIDGGVQIVELLKDSAAMNAGLRKGDIIVNFAGKEINNNKDLQKALAKVKKSKSYAMRIIRGGNSIFVAIKF